MKHFLSRFFFVVTLVFIFSVENCSLFAQGNHEVVVETGDAASGTSGAFDQILGPVLMNSDGKVWFNSSLSGSGVDSSNDAGVFQITNGGPSLLVRKGDSFGTTQIAFGDFELFGTMGDDVYFGTQLPGIGGNGLYRSSAGTIQEVSRFFSSSPRLMFTSTQGNSSGQFSYSDLSGGDRLFISDQSTTRLIAQQGMTIGSNRIATLIGGPHFAPHSNVNEAGAIAFGGITNSGRRKYYLALPNTNANQYVELLDLPNVQLGSATPDLNDNSQIALQGYQSFFPSQQNVVVAGFSGISVVAREGQQTSVGQINSIDRNVFINNQGQVAWAYNNGSAIKLSSPVDFFSSQNEAETIAETQANNNDPLVAFQGQQAPDSTATFDQLSLGHLTENGIVTFESTLNTGGDTERGYFMGDGIDLVEVVTTGGDIADFQVNSTSIVESTGQVAYSRTLSNGKSQVIRYTPRLSWRTDADGNWDDSGVWTLGLAPSTPHDVSISSDQQIEVLGPDRNVSTNSLRIGGANGSNRLKLQNGHNLTVNGGLTVANNGVLAGNGSLIGDINVLSGGGLRVGSTSGADPPESLFVNGKVTNSGQVLVQATSQFEVSNDFDNRGNLFGPAKIGGRYVGRSGSRLISNGTIESVGGFEIQSGALISNTSVTAELIGDINNQGTISGSFNVAGNVNNAGVIELFSFSQPTTIVGDLAQNGTLDVNIGTVIVQQGMFSGTGGSIGSGTLVIEDEFSPGNSMASINIEGNLNLGQQSTSLFEIGGAGVGSFDQVVVGGNSVLGGSLNLSFADGFNLSPEQSLTLFDIAGLQSGTFQNFSEGDLVGTFGGIELFFSYQGGNGNDVSVFTLGPVWRGGDGLWSDASLWKNGKPTSANSLAIIDNDADVNSVVSTSGENVTIQNLRVDSGDTLFVERGSNGQGNLTFESFSGSNLRNDGLIEVSANNRIAIRNDLNISGTGTLNLLATSSRLIPFASELRLTNGVEHTIQGQGTIQAKDIDNLGLIEANVLTTSLTNLTIAGPDTGFNGLLNNQGIIRASNGGGVQIQIRETNGGIIEAVGSGSLVRFISNRIETQPATMIRNVTFRTSNGGVVEIDGNSRDIAFLDNVTNEGFLQSRHFRAFNNLHNTGRIFLLNGFDHNISLGSDLSVTGNGNGIIEFLQGGMAFTSKEFDLDLDSNIVRGLGTFDTASTRLGGSLILDPQRRVSSTRPEVGVFEFQSETTIDGSLLQIDIYGDRVASGNFGDPRNPDATIANTYRDDSFQENGLDQANIEYDQINVFDTLTLDQTVEIELTFQDGFAPEDGDFFDILTADQLILGDDFQLVLDAPVVDGKTFGFDILNLPDPRAGTNRDVVRLTWGVTAVPEPSVGWLILLVIVFQLKHRRRVTG